MQNTRILPIYCLLLLFAATGMAQTPPVYTLEHIGMEDGLSNNYVTDITQDRQGCLWIATEAGLNRFDGKDFTSFNTGNSSIKGNTLNTLLYDETENRLWIGSKSGLSLLDCTTQQFYELTFPDSIRLYNITTLQHTPDGGIWIANLYENILYYNKKTGQSTVYSSKTIDGLPNTCRTSLDDGEGHLYVGHTQEGMSIINLATKSLKNFRHQPDNPRSLPGNSVYCIYIDRFKNIWVATNQGLALFNPSTEEFITFHHIPNDPHSLISDHIYTIKEMKDGYLWIGSDTGGVSLLDLRNLTFTNPDRLQFHNITVTHDNYGISSGNIRSLFQDSFGNIWIGNYSSGLDFISHTQPVFHILPYAIERGWVTKSKSIWSLCNGKEKEIWAGSENEVALFRNRKLERTIDISPYLTRSYAQVCAMLNNGDNLLLGLFDDGLLELDTRNDHIKRLDLGKNNVDINTFHKDANGKIWIGTEFGLYSYENGEVREEEEINEQISYTSVYDVLHDQQSKLWIGTYGNGIIIFDKDGKQTAHLHELEGFCSNAINQLYMDTQGGIWVATREGLGYIKDTEHPGQFQSYQYAQGLENIFIRAIHEDHSGNLWFSTNNGISRRNKQTGQFENYDYRNGIPQDNFMDRAVCMTSEGTLLFGSLSGTCYLNPQDFYKTSDVAPVQIIECQSLNKQIESSKGGILLPAANGSIELPHHRNSFRIAFSVPDYSQSRLVEYAYLAEGLENTWTHTSGENQVTFRNITPGEYTFKVKARLRNQEWDDTHIATLKVHIHPPLWFTWYAKIFYLLAILSTLFIWFRFYKRKLILENSLELERRKSLNEQELNNERLRFYTNITHELRTPLTLILGPLEDLISDSQVPTTYANKIKVIHTSALRLLSLINQILEFRKMETQNRKLTVTKGNLSNLVKEIGLRYKELNRNEEVKFNIDVDTEENELYYDADIISTILNNLLSNAMKYTPAGEITLAIHSVTEGEDKYTEIIVSDTGYGIDAEALPHIYDRYYQAKGKHQASGTGIGLALVKSLADLHKGILNVWSEIGKGTTFTFRLLSENTYPDALHKELKSETNFKEPPRPEEEKEDTDIRPMILVVEDNDDIREYIASSFSDNYRIITATNGKEGIEQARKYTPDIIISDIMMPVMDGIELCRNCKEDVRTSHIPIILLTAKDSIQDKEKGYESGADSYLTKPFSAKLLNSRVHNLLESRKKLAAFIADRTKELKPAYPQESVKLNKLDEEFLNRLTSIIEGNIESEKLDMPFIMDKMHMSHSTLYRKIKSLTGISGNEFIRKLRLKNSLRLLVEERNNISEAAYASGFNDLGYFRACFREEYGMSPSEYLKQMLSS